MAVSNTDSTQKESTDPHKALRRVVVGMGVLLVAGFVLLIILLALGVHKKPKRSAIAAEPQGQCQDAKLTLADDELVQRVENQNALTHIITLDGLGVTRVYHVDDCSGVLRNRLHISPKMAD